MCIRDRGYIYRYTPRRYAPDLNVIFPSTWIKSPPGHYKLLDSCIQRWMNIKMGVTETMAQLLTELCPQASDNIHCLQHTVVRQQQQQGNSRYQTLPLPSSPVLSPGKSLYHWVLTLLVSPLYGRLWTNTTSSTKPEEHNVSQSHQMRTQTRLEATCGENLVKLRRVVSEICSRTDIQTDRRAHDNTP